MTFSCDTFQGTAGSSIAADQILFTNNETFNDTVAGSYSAGSTTVSANSFSTVRLTGSVASLGAVNIGGSLDVTAATLAPGATTLPSLILGGTLAAIQNLTVTAPFNWTPGGTLQGVNGQGSLTAAGGMTITGGTANGFSVINPGTATWTGGSACFYGNSSFTNTATGAFDDQIDGTFGSCDGNCQDFFNQGTFLKSGGTGTTDLQMQLINSGTVNIEHDILNVSCGYVQGAGGSISGSVSNPGQYNSGPSSNPPPVLTSYTQTATGTLYEQIGGLTAGTQYGQIIVNGSVNLAGNLQVALVNGFTPTNGNQFIIIDNTGGSLVNGTFTGLPEGSTVWDTTHTYHFLLSYVGGEGKDVVLTAQQTATTTAVTASANPSQLNQNVTFTATVTPAAGNGTPTGTVQFQIDSSNAGTPVTLNSGKASFSTSTLAAGTHTITALYSGDSNFLSSSGSLTQNVHYTFSGFLPPLSKGLVFAVNRTIPIKFQLSDATGNAITSLSAVTSLQIQALDANGNPVGVPFAPASTNNQGLQFTGGQYLFNWQTKGLAASSYQIVLTLADGTTQTKTIQLTAAGSAAGLVTGSSGGTATAGALLGGEVDLYVDNSNGDLTSDELARILDAVNAVDTTIAPYGVVINEVSDPTQANVTLNMNTTSALEPVREVEKPAEKQ